MSTCDGCGVDLVVGDGYVRLITTDHTVSVIEGETCQPPDSYRRLCPECWAKMLEALKK